MTDWREQAEEDERSEIDTLKRIFTAVSGVILICAGALSAFVSWGPLGNLFEEYQDSAVSTYLVFGLPLLIGGLVAIVAGIWLLARSRPGSD